MTYRPGSYHMTPFRFRGVRYNPETGAWEMRCDDCARSRLSGSFYWPITSEFWNPKAGAARCRACNADYARRRERERYWRDPEFRARKLEQMREGRKAKAAYDRVRLDPEKWARRVAQAREYQRRKRAA